VYRAHESTHEHAVFSALLTRNARGGRTLALSPPSASSPPRLPNPRDSPPPVAFTVSNIETDRRRIHLLHRIEGDVVALFFFTGEGPGIAETVAPPPLFFSTT
jgi:hypothetical protein